MWGSWQVTRQKKCNFLSQLMWSKICRAPSPLLCSSSCHCICIKKNETWFLTWIWSAYEYDKNAKICPPISSLLMVPCRCKWAWVWLQVGWLLLLTSGSYSAVAPSVAKAMEAAFLPALDEDQANYEYVHVHPIRVVPVLTCSGP